MSHETDDRDETADSGITPGTLRYVYLVMLSFMHMQTAVLSDSRALVFSVSAILVLLAYYVGAVTEREKQSGPETAEG